MKDPIRGTFPVRDLDIEAYLCGELEGAARRGFELELERSPELQVYLDERILARSRFLREHPLRLPLTAAPQRKHDGSVLWGGLLAAVAVAALFVPGRPVRDHDFVRLPSATEDTVRVKGNTLAAELFVKRGETVFRYRPGTVLQPQDRVRLSVECPSSGYLTVFGRDGSGEVSVYYAGLLTSPGRYTVPDSLILDDVDGDEEWVLVFALEAEPVERYIDAFTNGQPIGAAHAIFHLHKETQ
jgi:hypothetical protein